MNHNSKLITHNCGFSRLSPEPVVYPVHEFIEINTSIESPPHFSFLLLFYILKGFCFTFHNRVRTEEENVTRFFKFLPAGGEAIILIAENRPYV